eukprot:TRINITY_DN5543_c0_g1_i1.p1 TRINITY_DN5543_c0_g1~~TRINITY_DN5543_c0_g1_i1.p1  ORF type:complete len:143 (+),score=28.67 TRINITY_DN5543_c0_g1_i1:127-555(+)
MKATGVSPIAEIPFANLMLGFLVGTLLIYLFYKLVFFSIENSKVYGTYLHPGSLYIWGMFLGGAIFGGYAVTLFMRGVTDKTKSPALSREMNEECYWFDYFDAHDVWHFFAGLAVVTVLCLILHINPPVNREDYRKNFVRNV